MQTLLQILFIVYLVGTSTLILFTLFLLYRGNQLMTEMDRLIFEEECRIETD